MRRAIASILATIVVLTGLGLVAAQPAHATDSVTWHSDGQTVYNRKVFNGIVGRPLTTDSIDANCPGPVVFDTPMWNSGAGGIIVNVPPGMTFDTATGVFSGTPTTTFWRNIEFTYTGCTGTPGVRLRIIVVGPISPAAQGPTNSVVGAPISTTPMSAPGLNAPVTYSISPALSPGLSFDTSTGVISGTPSTPSTLRTYTITGTGADSATATATVQLNVLSMSPDQQVYEARVGEAMVPTEPISAAGFEGTVSYMPDGNPQAGMTFDTATGVISGTPSMITGVITYRVYASGSISGWTSVTFTLEIPGIIDTIVGRQITPTPPPVPFDCNGTPQYEMTDPLPAGLTLDPLTGIVTGTPSEVVDSQNYMMRGWCEAGGGMNYRFAINIDPVPSSNSGGSAPAPAPVPTPTASPTPTPTPTPAPTSSGPTSTTVVAPVQPFLPPKVNKTVTGGLVIVSSAAASAAPVDRLKSAPSTTFATAPLLVAPLGDPIKLQPSGFTPGVSYTITMTSGGKVVVLGTVTPDATGKLRLPVVMATRLGSSTISIAPPTGKPAFIKVKYKSA